MTRRKNPAGGSATGDKRAEAGRESGSGASTNEIDLIGEDLLQNILSRLPALTFASAACVSRTWSSICKRVLSRPKLSSAFSLHPNPEVAVEEVVNKVLSEPLRPDFAIVCISPAFSLQQIHQLIIQKLGSATPIVTYESMGIIGRNAITDELKEIDWDMTMEEDCMGQLEPSSFSGFQGILLVVGFVPGLKVDAIPLSRPIKDPGIVLVDDFVKDIKEYTASVSGCTSPAGMIMFGGPSTNMKPVLDKLDYSMSAGTFIVGDESGRFIHRGSRRRRCNSLGVALVFVRDRNKPHGIGDIDFHVTVSTGLSPVGQTFKAAAVKERRHCEDCTTWLTARRQDLHDILDGETMLADINDEIGDNIEYAGLYIGVTKRRKISVGLEKVKWVTTLAFHEVTRGDEQYLYVNGSGIRTGDSFRFYYSDSSAAASSCSNVSEKLRRLKDGEDDRVVCKNATGGAVASDGNKKEVFGGMIFACSGRGESFFGRSNVDSSPFLDNFPGVPFAGTFCCGEICRGSSSLYSREAQEQSDARCCLHVYSSCYLVMSYTPLPEP
ncbi:hypothetical protein RHSIM_Rhsim08G0191500 [Rhododendron simsii]|uniref:FIST C-domain domain-containing protein n=1 Tax=Rhododendron simsii TaxID=118357 RepID=A0A834GKE4_RHOSS|nr:hypothetical protein RHSIM_Rhsim08G0191500 [Rhododendron simsii]